MKKETPFTKFITKIWTSSFRASQNLLITNELFTIKRLFLGISKGRKACNRPLLAANIQTLAYLAMSGIEIDFGGPEILTLVESSDYHQKAVGWTALMLLNVDDECLKLFLPVLQKDLCSFEHLNFQRLAIHVVTGLFSKLVYQLTGPKIAEMSISPHSPDVLRKDAIHAASYIYGIIKDENMFEILKKQSAEFLKSSSSSLRLAGATAVVRLMEIVPGCLSDIFPLVLDQIVLAFNTSTAASMYYGTPEPWFIKQMIKILGFKRSWDAESLAKLDQIQRALLQRQGEKLSIRPAMSYFMVFSEVIEVLCKIPSEMRFIDAGISTLGRYLESERADIIYFALDGLCRLLRTKRGTTLLRDRLSYLYGILSNCDADTVCLAVNVLCYISLGEEDVGPSVVKRLIACLPNAPFEARDTVCMKTAEIAESLNNGNLLIDTILALLFEAGEWCQDSLWYITSKRIASDPELQQYAVKATLDWTQKRIFMSDQFIRFMMHIGGDYSTHEDSSTFLNIISSRIECQKPSIQAMMITTVMKILVRTPKLLKPVRHFLTLQSVSPHIQVSQRACQFLMILEKCSAQSPVLVSRKPVDFTQKDLDSLLDKVVAKAKGEEGVSTFELIMQPGVTNTLSREEMIEGFLSQNFGFIYHDVVLTIHMEFDVDGTQIEACFRFDNQGVLPITAINLAIEESEELKVQFDSYSSEIPAKKSIEAYAIFDVIDAFEELPHLKVQYSCAGNRSSLECVVPIHLIRLIQNQESLHFQAPYVKTVRVPDRTQIVTDLTTLTGIILHETDENLWIGNGFIACNVGNILISLSLDGETLTITSTNKKVTDMIDHYIPFLLKKLPVYCND